MNQTLLMALLLLGLGVFCLIQGCAAPSHPEPIDQDQIRQHSEEGFKDLQKEERRK
ncbi:MAG: hypothetical protein HZA19_05300 [Nitrospirae bacterium]|nr:hypothetical protein [Nitrospirota bacterium]